MGFFTGSKAKDYQRSTLTKEQKPGLTQLTDAAQGKASGGVWGDLTNYYQDLMNPNGENYSAMQAPQMRQFNEDIIPGISEQFAGMGSGGLSSSSFRNAAVNAGTDLSERLGAIRANLRQQGASGLANIGQQALGNYSENIHQPASGGFLEAAAPALGTAIGSFAGPAGAAAGGAAASWLTNAFGSKASSKGVSSPYGNMPSAQSGPKTSGNYNLPTFGGW